MIENASKISTLRHFDAFGRISGNSTSFRWRLTHAESTFDTGDFNAENP